MESRLYSENVLSLDFLKYNLDYSYVLDAAFLFLFLVIVLYLSKLFYSKVRKKFPIGVNCWFCCTNCKVPYESYNSWNCPQCGQYNGFTEDGDYNKIIKEQYTSKLNDTFLDNSNKVSSKDFIQRNGLCKLCNINQQLKIQQLALFVPLNEKNYDEEIEEYRQKLENAYKLCFKCDEIVKETLEKKEHAFIEKHFYNKKENSSEFKITKQFQDYSFAGVLIKVKSTLLPPIKWLSLSLSIFLLLELITKYETKNQHLALSNWFFFDTSQPIIKVVLLFLNEGFKYEKEIALIGFVLSLLFIFENANKSYPVHIFVCFTWGLLYILFWCEIIELQIIVCATTVIFSHQNICRRKIYFNKKSLAQKLFFQTIVADVIKENKYSREEHSSEPNLLKNENLFNELRNHSQSPAGTIKSDRIFRDVVMDGPSNEFFDISKKEVKKNENEIESLSSDEPKAFDSLNKHKSAGSKPYLFSKSLLTSLEANSDVEDICPTINEVNNHLNDLSLGKKEKKQKKTSNFLFESHNFADKKLSQSIIKPPRFIKNLSNSWISIESNESISRSSTPSTGYSGYRVEPSRFELPQSFSPINPFIKPDSCDCLEVRKRFYNHCYYPQEFLPFPYYSNPLSHSAVYTCTRPVNFHFPFSPQKFSFNNSYLQNSDVSENENLFQSASKNFEISKKWFKFKTFSYYFSILLNCLTLLGFTYFFYTGIISIDWDLSKINFLF